MTLPLIGLTSKVSEASEPFNEREADVQIGHWYVQHVQRCGGVAVLIPPREDMSPNMARRVLSALDGLIITGGADVSPAYYQEQPHPKSGPFAPERDMLDITLLREAQQMDLPVLGVCRGMQVMAAERGGKLCQHIPDVFEGIHDLPGNVYSQHPVCTVEGTKLDALIGDCCRQVYGKHHQSVLTHPGYVPAAWSADGVLEAMEDPTRTFQIGVQWHPEVADQSCILRAFVAAAVDYAQGRTDRNVAMEYRP